MAEARPFDIYRTASGYVAVTNPVRRAILDALRARGELELGDLVTVTGKSKPTLSNLHMRELLDQRLVEERANPTDARRKSFRLVAAHIGSSNLPVEQLRDAVKHYVTLAPLAYAVPFATVVDVLLADGTVDAAHLRAQGRALGARTSAQLACATTREALASVAAFWEREGLAVRAEARASDLAFHAAPAFAARAPESFAALLAGALEGVLRARLADDRDVLSSVSKTGRVVLALTS